MDALIAEVADLRLQLQQLQSQTGKKSHAFVVSFSRARKSFTSFSYFAISCVSIFAMTFSKRGITPPLSTIFRHPGGFLKAVFTVDLQKIYVKSKTCQY